MERDVARGAEATRLRTPAICGAVRSIAWLATAATLETFDMPCDSSYTDKARVEAELAAAEDAKAKAAAIAKLTQHERKLLGIR